MKLSCFAFSSKWENVPEVTVLHKPLVNCCIREFLFLGENFHLCFNVSKQEEHDTILFGDLMSVATSTTGNGTLRYF